MALARATWVTLIAVLLFLLMAPAVVRCAWDDWRFHVRRYPGCGYTLLQALRMHFRIWWREVRE